ncbi:MAG: SMP-30/gluconolactonase/LRE family protein [Dehalococcoidia bacterium]
MPPQFEIISDEFRHVLGDSPKLTEIATGMKFSEGTTYVPDGDYVIWSDIPNNRIMRWSEKEGTSVFRQPSGNANGNTVDRDGRIISCETSGRRVSRTEHDGTVVSIADRYNDGRLTSPNDVCVKSDGSVWFTDPDYGFLHPELGHGDKPEQDHNRVYRLDPGSGELGAVSEDFDKPNGIAFSPDESILYVGDTGRTHGEFRPHRLMAFDVLEGHTLANPRVFAVVDPWVPDGFRVDVDGNVYVTAGDGVQVFTPGGDMIGKIHTPEVAANCAFGRADYDTLFIAATSSVWSVRLNTAGARRL